MIVSYTAYNTDFSVSIGGQSELLSLYDPFCTLLSTSIKCKGGLGRSEAMKDNRSDEIGDRIDSDDHGQQIAHDPARTLERSIDNYRNPELIPFFEWIQNGHEALINNKKIGAVPEDRPFRLYVSLDTETNTLVKIDNAGGVGGTKKTTEKKFIENYLGLDKPGEEKQVEETAGGYGRGATTVLSLGTDGFYVETLHRDTHVSITGDMTKAMIDSNGVTEETYDLLDESGTACVIRGVDPEIVESMAKRDRIHTAVTKKFPTLVSDDNVEIIFEIDGDEVEINDFDIDRLRDVAPLDADYPTTLPAVRKGSNEYRVKNVELFDARELPDGEEAPWEGILMMNTDQNGNLEMTVKTEYTPKNCRAVSQGEMFGICDITEFCPKYEDSAHDGLSGIEPAELGIAELLREISREEFSTEPDDRNVKEESRRKINQKLAENSAFTIGKEPSTNTDVDNSNVESDDVEVSEPADSEDVETETGPMFSATVTNRAEHAGDDVTVEFTVPAEFKNAAAVTNISVREILTNESIADFEPRDTESGGIIEVTFAAHIDGRYVITATLRDDNGEGLGGATTFTTVGDAPTTSEEAQESQFVDEHLFMKLGEKRRKAMVYENEDGELTLAINADRELYLKLTERSNDERVQNNIEMLFYKWGLPAIKDWMLANGAEEFVDQRKIDTTPEDYIADEFSEIEIELVQSIEGKSDIVVA